MRGFFRKRKRSTTDSLVAAERISRDESEGSLSHTSPTANLELREAGSVSLPATEQAAAPLLNHTSDRAEATTFGMIPNPAHQNESPLRPENGQTYGLRVLYQPPKVSEALVDIIFVHGLTGDSLHTWLEPGQNKYWPTDILIHDLTTARILVFGYDTDVAKIIGPVSQNNLRDHALTLLSDLASHRIDEASENRKIIFVVHSLGGLVLKKALCISESSHEEHLRQADRCTTAIAFLGTPHRGSDFASFATAAAQCLKLSYKRVNTDILKLLKKDSEVLADVEDAFGIWLRKKASSVNTTCFYEELELPGIGKVVTKDSAKLSGFQQLPIHANHMGMTKFASSKDIGYQRVVGEIRRWLKQVPVPEGRDALTEEHKASLQSLYFPEMYSRQNDIADPINKTCMWLLKHETYLDWRSRRLGLLWIRGNPGAGKSTLLKYALKQQECQDKFIIVSFFFHGSGALIQKSPLGLFRALLYQILQYDRSLLSEFSSLFQRKRDTQGELGEKWDWQAKELQDLFEAYVIKATKESSIRIFVDALDESGEEDALHLVEFFKYLIEQVSQTKTSFQICFSCRHYPLISLSYGLQLNVDGENQADIKSYIHDKLINGIRDEVTLQALQEDILRRSSSVFQWVIIVVSEVLTLNRKGKSLKFIRNRIRVIPEQLNNIYHELLEGMHVDEKAQALHLMQWICCAVRPLSLEELRIAMAVDTNSPYKSLAQCRESEEYTETDDEMEKKVRDLSKGLAEVKEGVLGVQGVECIHQSVLDFFLQTGLKMLDASSTFSVIGSAHFRLSRSCLSYLAMKEIGDWISYERKWSRNEPYQPKPPFVEYAVQDWLPHAEVVEQEKVPQRDLVDFFYLTSEYLLERWIQLYRITFIPSNYWPAPKSKFLHIASEHNFRDVVSTILDRGYDRTSSRDGHGHTPIWLAASEGHEALVKLLLKRNDFVPDCLYCSGEHAILLAAENGHVAIVKLFLKRDDVEADSKDRYNDTPLSCAAQNGHEAVVKLLLERDDVEADSKNKGYYTPLSLAAREGHEAIVKLLLERDDVEADSKDLDDYTPLSHAAQKRHEAIVKLLLERDDVDVNTKDRYNSTPLLYAAQGRHEAVIKLLLERDDVEADSKDVDNRTSLSYAAQEGHEAIVKLLLERDDVEADSKDVKNRTSLSYAAQEGHEAIVKLLLERDDVEADSKDVDNRTSLSYAAREGHEAIVKLLLERDDVDVNAKNRYDCASLLYAAMCGHEAMIKLLLERDDVDVNAKDRYNSTPLLYAVQGGHEAVIKLLLERGVDVNAMNDGGRTPLSIAIETGHGAVAQLLSTAGAVAPTMPADDLNLRHPAVEIVNE